MAQPVAPGVPGAPGAPGAYQPPTQANRPSGLPPNFQPPANLPNINFNARVIRLGTTAANPKPATTHEGRRDGPALQGRSGLGMDRDYHPRGSARDVVVPFTTEDKLRTLFVGSIPEGVSDEDMQKMLNAAGRLRKWESMPSTLSDSPAGFRFGLAQFEDAESLSHALEVVKDVEVPTKKQKQVDASEQKADFEGIEKVKLQVTTDKNSKDFLESYKEGAEESGDGPDGHLEEARSALKQVLRNLFYPPLPPKANGDGDIAMTDANGSENVEVVNIPLAQEDELSDIPAEYRETVAREIAAFRERSTKQDLERMKQEEEMEAMERLRNGRGESPPSSNNIPLGPRGLQKVPAGPKGANGSIRVPFLNGGVAHSDLLRMMDEEENDDADGSDEGLYRREQARQAEDEERMFAEAERKWKNRERQKAAALQREKERENVDKESVERRKPEQLSRDKAWDDEREAARKTHLYYRDHAAWARQRARERAEEKRLDDIDRRAEDEEVRRHQADLERTRGIADSFLDQQAKEMEQREAATAPQQPFKLSLGAAAAKAQRAAPQRRTIAEVEGLLDDEEQDTAVRRQLIPIDLGPTSSMSDEDISAALRSLAQEIPSEKDGLWRWTVQWDLLDEAVMRDKLRPFVEKKIVEYLGVQEEVIVQVIEHHLRGHGAPGALVAELAEVSILWFRFVSLRSSTNSFLGT